MNAAEPFSNALNAWSTWAGGLPGGQGLSASPLDALMMQAHIASSAALLRSGQRASQSWLKYTQEVGASANLAGKVDAARAHLRHLAEISADEARQVEQMIRALDEQARALAAPPDDPAADPVRRAQAKP